MDKKYTEQESSAQLRETSSIFTMLLMLLQKHPHLILHLAFTKTDYSFLAKTYLPSIPLISHVNIEGFQSLSFLECLFKMKYFSLNTQDLLLLIKLLGSPIGVTFISPTNPQTVLDASYIIVNKIIQYHDP